MESVTMKIFLTGATGAIGKALTRQMVQAGHEVVGLVRSGNKGAQVEAQGGGFVIGDMLDPQDVRAAVRRVRPDAIVHEATALGGGIPITKFDEMFALTNQMRTKGTDYLLAAAADCDVRKIVVQSFCGWPLAKFGGAAADERHPFDAALPARQRSTSYALQYCEAAVAEAPTEGVALRYGGFYGPGTSICPGGSTVEDVLHRRLPLIGDGGGYWSFIHIEDAAAATLAALEPGRHGVYNIVDDAPARVREWVPYLAQLVGAPAPLHLPKFIGRLAGPHVVSMMTDVRGGSNAKARRELGWAPRYGNWRDGFAASFAVVGERALEAA
jgi:nucleoside-diphosphate-sugar epimerase